MEEEKLVKKELVNDNEEKIVPTNEINNQKNNSNKKGLIIGIVIAIILIIAGGVIYFCFIKKDDKTVDNKENNDQVVNNNSEDNDNEEDDINKIDKSWYGEYKTSDGKFILRITNDNKIYLNNNEIVENDNRIESDNYLQIFGNFISSENDIGLTFMLDKKNMEILYPHYIYYDSEDKNKLGEYAKFSTRIGLKLLNINDCEFWSYKRGNVTEVYLPDSDYIGYVQGTIENIKYDKDGIFFCSHLNSDQCVIFKYNTRVYELTSENQNVELENNVFQMKYIYNDESEAGDLYINNNKVATYSWYSNINASGTGDYLIVENPGHQTGSEALGYVDKNGNYYDFNIGKTIVDVYSDGGKIYGYITYLDIEKDPTKVELRFNGKNITVENVK